jgi:hypothetical protein
MNIFHLSTEEGTNARVALVRTKEAKAKTTQQAPSGEEVRTEKIHRGSVAGLDVEKLTPEALIEGDPEIDMAEIGKILPKNCTRAYRKPDDPEGKICGAFEHYVTTLSPAGEVLSKAKLSKKKSNINDLAPVKMGKRMPLIEALQKFVFHNNYALIHDDGVKYDFLRKIAEDLHTKKEVAVLGAGPKGKDPLVFIDGAPPCRAMLHGKVEDGRYQLVVLLTRQELKRPEEKTAPSQD